MNKEQDIKSIARKFMNGSCTPDELEAAMILFADPYHNLDLRPTLFENWNNEDKVLEQEIPNQDFTAILDKIHHRINIENDIKPIRKTKMMIFNVLKVAAILVIGLFLGLSVQYFKRTEPVYYTSIAPKGSVSQMILPDNTVVYLNAGSEIKYTVEGLKGKREVFLDGEAWFDVASYKKKPFVVHTPFYDVNVFGTKFNVKAYKADPEFVTTLEEGSIMVSSSEDLKLANSTILTPGEQLVYNSNNKKIEIKKVNTRIFTSWKDNKLIFINMNLKDLIVLLERKYGVDIEITDNNLLDYHYDGTIKNETILEVLDLLKETLPVKYKIEGQVILIAKK